MPGSFFLVSSPCLSLSSRRSDCSALSGNVLPTLVYPCLFAGPVFGQSIGQTLRYGLDGGDHLSSLLLGLDRDLFSLSGHHESSQGLQLYSNLFFTARNGLFYTPIFIFMGYYLYDHFHAQTF